MNKVLLSMHQIDGLAAAAARKIMDTTVDFGGRLPRVYAIPRGGIMAAMAIRQHVPFNMVDDPRIADYIVDDLIDSGETVKEVLALTQGRLIHPANVVVLLDKRHAEWAGKWVVFPWEVNETTSIEDNIRRLLQFVGEDASRGGLLETPHRVAKAWREWCSGYGQDPADVLKVFEDGAEGYDEMVIVQDIPIYSTCEHHMAAIFGTATIAYLPDGKVVGLSKLARLADIFARRLQVQERLTCQIADALMKHLQPKGCGVVIKARHLCMESRGVKQQGHQTITSALRGNFKDEPAVRGEFLALAQR